jgi:crotonobetainyl-CoA:carnitine CoA-transferase CaiB-like acyl-CoA transferase
VSRQPWLAATLPVLDLAVMSVEAVRSAAVAAGATGAIATAPMDLERVAGAFASDRLFREGGKAVEGFAPLSGFFRAADGWVRTHGNYPHHAERLAGVLGLAEPDRAAVAAAIAERRAQDVEDAAAEAGAILVRVRSEDEWRASEQGQAAASGPLVKTEVRDDARGSTLPGGERPLAGVRVLDLTRVLAGPVATRTLALLGADVLRIDPPQLPEIVWQHLDTGQGKRSALLDLRTARVRAQELLDRADVLVTGYRPGSVEAFGLQLPAGAVHARINAWGDTGPWAGRRGFDSIVQAASGIAMVESSDGDRPGTLPAQALDHASGYLLAAGVVEALTARAADGRGRDVLVALARTATWLLDAPGRTPEHPSPAVPTTTVTHGERTTAAPALPGFDDHPAPAREWGGDEPVWLSETY